MKLKLEENGNIVVEDGKPVFVDEDGKDVVVDVPQLFTKIKELNGESKQRRLEIGDFKKKYKLFQDIEELDGWKEGADKALELVKNIDQSQLIQAGKVEELKESMKKAFEGERENTEKAFGLKTQELLDQISQNEGTIFDLLVTSKFTQSPFFSGESPKTNVLPDMAAKYFGHQFKVEKSSTGSLKVVGYNLAGTQIYSRKNPGELANFDEAIAEIIDEYPMKERILKSSGGGSGGRGGSGGNEDDDLTKLKTKYAEAMKAGRTTQAIAIKNQIFQFESKK